MGKMSLSVPQVPKLAPIRVSAAFRARVNAAAKAAEQSVADYVRQAIKEKLERDGQQS